MKQVELFKNQVLSVLSGVSAEVGEYEYGGVPASEGDGGYPITFKTYDNKHGMKATITPHMLRGDGWGDRAQLIGKQIRDAIWEKEHGCKL